jgi:hypothetical protein
MQSIPYAGYLAPHVGLIRELHERGASTWAIAEALYDAGARAQTSSPYSVAMGRANHLTNLQGMVIYIERRLGLRTRRIRILNLKKSNEKRAPGLAHQALQIFRIGR